MPTVKCRDCGYLAIRDPFSPNPAMTEAYELVRNQGWQNASNGKRTIARLYCYAKKRTFANPLVDQPKKIIAEIGQGIECDAFRQWHPGKSPEKHEEMTIVERVEAINAKARQEDIARQEKWNRRNFHWMVVAAGAALISALSAIIAAYVHH